MSKNVVLTIILFASVALAGCFGGAAGDDEEPADQPPAEPPAQDPPATDPDPQPEPFEPTEVVNTTLQFDVQTAASKTFAVPEGAGQLAGAIAVDAREVCSVLQADADEEGPSVVFIGPEGANHEFKLTPRSAVCATNGDPLETVDVTIAAVDGQWSVELVGTGNVDVSLSLTATA